MNHPAAPAPVTFSARQVFQFDLYARLNGLDALAPAERSAVDTLRHEREVCAAYYRAYSGGRFADGSRMYAESGRTLALSERTGISLYVATHGNNRESFEVSLDAHRCPACEGDGEVGVHPYAWCSACHGTGLAAHECESCGAPTALDTVDRVPLECVGVVVHAGCDTGHRFFDRRPAPQLRGAA